MKKTINLLAVALLAFASTFSVSCSEDGDEYKSVSPKFSNVTFTPEEIFPGERITATAVQYKKGKLLDRTSYSWSVEGTTEDLNIESNKNLFYDNDKSNPTCVFTAPSTPGQYTLVFNAKYNASGQSTTSTSTVSIEGGTVDYTSGPFNCTVVIRKKFRVTNR